MSRNISQQCETKVQPCGRITKRRARRSEIDAESVRHTREDPGLGRATTEGRLEEMSTFEPLMLLENV
jgi:hypothetical protein